MVNRIFSYCLKKIWIVTLLHSNLSKPSMVLGSHYGCIYFFPVYTRNLFLDCRDVLFTFKKWFLTSFLFINLKYDISWLKNTSVQFDSTLWWIVEINFWILIYCNFYWNVVWVEFFEIYMLMLGIVFVNKITTNVYLLSQLMTIKQ